MSYLCMHSRDIEKETLWEIVQVFAKTQQGHRVKKEVTMVRMQYDSV